MPEQGTSGGAAAGRDEGLPPAPPPPRYSGVLLPLAGIALGVSSLLSFGAVGREFYQDFRLPHGSGMNHLLPEELAFYSLFFVFGGAATAGLWLALRATRVTPTLLGAVRAAASFGWVLAGAVALLVAVACALISRDVLRHAVISDDEHAYRFIAQTLRRGGLTAPSPGTDLAFFREQFVVLTPFARFGKYPVGHPLVLAAGQALGLEALVVPVITGLLGMASYAVGRGVGGSITATVALVLFATSPQVLLTGATLLSQPTAALSACLAVLCLFAAERPGRAELAWLAATGAALGFGVLVRPLPIALFVPVAFAYALWTSSVRRPALLRLAVLGAPVAAALVVMVLINRAQVGHALVTAYGESLAAGRGPGTILLTVQASSAMRAMSLAGGLVRLNFWLFGWPLSLALCLLAGRSRRHALLWAFVGGALVYRLAAPKVGVGGAGPVYFFEVLPILCVLTADGVIRLARAAPHPLASPTSLVALILAAAIVNVSAFLPPRLADLRRMGSAQNLVSDTIRERGISHALVFHEAVVPWPTRASWAYYPRKNSPAVDDDVLFILLQRANGLRENLEFWRRRFPDRSAWYFGYVEGRAVLVPLEDFVRAAERSAGAMPGARP